MPWAQRSQTSSVKQLCQWFEARNEQPTPRPKPRAIKNPPRMNNGDRVAPVEETRARFLQNLKMFEQSQTTLPQRGMVFHRSSPALHQTVATQSPSCLSSQSSAAASGGVSHTVSSLGISPSPFTSTANPWLSHDCERNSLVSPTDISRNVSPSSAKVTSGSDSSKNHHSRSISHGTRQSHQPAIRDKKEEVERDGGRGKSIKKNPLFRVLSSHSGLGSKPQAASDKKSSQLAAALSSHKYPHAPVPDRTERPAVCFQPHSSRRRQSVADPRDLLQPQHPKRGHRASYDFTAYGGGPSNHLSRMVSTASIQLRKHSLPVSRKRSSSEERRISIIQNSKCFPETLTKPSPMLDEWLSSLVKQARVVPNEEEMECSEEPLPVRQHQPYSSLCSENSWQHNRNRSHQQSWHSGRESVRNRTCEQRGASGIGSEVCDFSRGVPVCADSNNPSRPVSDGYSSRRRSSKDGAQPKRCERHSSEEKLSPQSSVTGASSVPVRLTEEDEDSACVQSMSDSASVQLCVPLSEDPSTSPRQHLPLSPCSSLGSYHSAMSSNADSAVDMALPDDESSEVEAAQEGTLDVAGVKLKQALFAQSHCSSSTSSSSCQTVVDLVNIPSSVKPVTPPPPPGNVSNLRLELPSFLISDHSSNGEGSPGESLGADRIQFPVLMETGQVLEPGGLHRSPSATSSSSEGSFCSTCWTDSSVSDNELPERRPERKRKQSSWKKIRSIIRWSPFIQVFKKHRYPWIQLAGHQGNFQAGEAGSVLKKLDSREHQSFQRLMHDRLQPYVPEFRGVVEKNGERYVQLQDLLCEFNSPCVMDIKMGVRTYLEEELTKARKKPTLRKDMYQKMVDVDSNAPTAEEHLQRAVTKPRYMQWRDQMSSSVNLGFRIEGIKKSDGASSKDFKKTKTRESVVDVLKAFIGDDETILTKYLQRLRDISATQESSEFFRSHEVVGSSLLFVHDSQGQVNVWMIDFGKTEPLPKSVAINHRATWVEGNHEDGYLFGLDNIISILEELQASSVA